MTRLQILILFAMIGVLGALTTGTYHVAIGAIVGGIVGYSICPVGSKLKRAKK